MFWVTIIIIINKCTSVDRLKVYNWFIFLEVDILIRAEIFGERNACEVFAPGAVVDGGVVEDHDEDTNNDENAGKAQDYQYGTSGSGVNSSVKGDIWHKCIG